jgi:hypothetical protein
MERREKTALQGPCRLEVGSERTAIFFLKVWVEEYGLRMFL